MCVELLCVCVCHYREDGAEFWNTNDYCASVPKQRLRDWKEDFWKPEIPASSEVIIKTLILIANPVKSPEIYCCHFAPWVQSWLLDRNNNEKVILKLQNKHSTVIGHCDWMALGVRLQGGNTSAKTAQLSTPNLHCLSCSVYPYLDCFELAAANVSASQATDKCWIM